jgi:chromosome segregation ATPase
MVEQEACWRRLSAEPEIVPRLRDACRHALVTYAWHLEQQLSVQSGLAPVVELERKIQSLREKNSALKQRLAEQSSSLKRVRKEREDLQKKLARFPGVSGWWRRLTTRLQGNKTEAALSEKKERE